MKNYRKNVCTFIFLLLCVCAAGAIPANAQQEQKDYLSSMEADKIRDAETTNERVKLFLTFADDRLKKL
ncbi:MAG: hypothetical protein M3N22_07430, partial [Acidobacteriota bacterium]|nr:hypothetical protein [Acidobacteriota bacterium]